MVSVGRIAFVMIVCAIAVSVSGADNIKLNDAPEEVKLAKNQEEMEDMEENEIPHKTTVHHFARHGLCSHIHGKLKFFKALQKHFIGISDHMRVNFIMDICSQKDECWTNGSKKSSTLMGMATSHISRRACMITSTETQGTMTTVIINNRPDAHAISSLNNDQANNVSFEM